jgi:hypothetical protein
MATLVHPYEGRAGLPGFLERAGKGGITEILMQVGGGTTVVKDRGMFYSQPLVRITCSFDETQQQGADPLADKVSTITWHLEEVVKTGQQEYELVRQVESALRRRGFAVARR